MSRPRPILIAIDAFGTLFSPKSPIGQQYAAVAADYGLKGLQPKDINSSFYTSYKQTNRNYPNYGKEAGLDLEKWWRKVILGCFEPHITPQQLPLLDQNIVPTLINRFWCSDGYYLHQDALDFVRQVHKLRRNYENIGTVVFGVLSNSDTRVADVLKSFDYRVAKLRTTTTDLQVDPEPADSVDFQFVIHSYDVGHEKPAKEIFDAAESLARQVLLPTDQKDEQLLKLYVGDEMAKDGIGAKNAGWHAVVVDRDQSSLQPLTGLDELLKEFALNAPIGGPLIKQVSSLSSTT